jgi:hypothetical protein
MTCWTVTYTFFNSAIHSHKPTAEEGKLRYSLLWAETKPAALKAASKRLGEARIVKIEEGGEAYDRFYKEKTYKLYSQTA